MLFRSLTQLGASFWGAAAARDGIAPCHRMMAASTVSKPGQDDAGGKPAGAPGADTAAVSSDVRFAADAIEASVKSPDVRPAEVERAKALLADGKVGNDPGRLAEALIKHLLDS